MKQLNFSRKIMECLVCISWKPYSRALDIVKVSNLKVIKISMSLSDNKKMTLFVPNIIKFKEIIKKLKEIVLRKP